MASWAEVIAALGPAVADHVGNALQVRHLVVAPAPEDLREGDVVLAVGHNDAAAFGAFAASFPLAASLGFVVRATAAARPDLVALARRNGVRLIVLEPDVDWILVIERARGILSADPAPAATMDLAAIAATAADIIGGPVTIEDRAGHVISYGGDHGHADPARIASILQRRVPDELRRRLDAAGVQELIRAAGSAVALPPIAGLAPRVVAPIRSGGELLGAAWALVPEPASAQQLDEFARCASQAALHLLRASAPGPVVHSIENDALAALLYGGAGAAAAARALSLRHTSAAVAVLTVIGGDIAESTRSRARLRARLLSAAHRRLDETSVGDLNGTLFVILPAAAFATPQAATRWLEEHVVAPVAHASTSLVVGGVGEPTSPADLPASRHQAELAMAVAGESGRAVVLHYGQVWALSFLRRLADLPLATELHRAGPVEQLVALDAENGTAYVATLQSHLLHSGDAQRVAADLHIHPNTYRYRMRRISELVQLDLDRIDTHAAICVQLALLDVARRPGRGA